MKKFSLLLLTALITKTISAGNPAKTGDLQYIQNNGQWQNNIQFAADIYGGRLFLEKNCFTWAFTNEYELSDFKHNGQIDELNHFIIKRHAFKTNFINANPNVILKGENAFSNYYNYFSGHDPSKWRPNVSAFNTVKYENLYDGINLVVYSQDNSMKYDFVVAPHISPRTIRINYEGLDDISISDGNLELTTSLNEIIEYKPVAYQIINGVKVDVPCSFQIWQNEVSFIFPQGHNSNYELIIDPATLIFSSYSGSTIDNWGYAATYDNDGNLYGAGIAFGIGYPVTLGAYQESWAGGTDLFASDIAISKFSPDGTSLIYSTYLGGSNDEIPLNIAVNESNELVVFGATGSDDFPVTPDAIDTSFNGGDSSKLNYVLIFNHGIDGLIAKFNADGSELIGSTFLGGSANDVVNEGATAFNYGDLSRSGIVIDNEDNIFIAATTKSIDLPASADAFQMFNAGNSDGFIAKLNSDLTVINWLTYLGGADDDALYSIDLTTDHSVVVAGGTNSSDFPATAGALTEEFNGGTSDGMIAIISSDGNSLLNATYIGTAEYDQVYLTDHDEDNSIYITGQSSGEFPVISAGYSVPGSSQFIAHLDPALSEIEMSTVFGDGGNQINLAPTAFMVDDAHKIYYAGWGGAVNQTFNLNVGNTSGLSYTDDAFQTTTDGSDFYFMVLGENADSLLYATFFGGIVADEHVDGGTSDFDANGILYEAVCAGCGGADDFPTTDGVVSNTNNASNCNLGVLKIDLGNLNDTTITSIIDQPFNALEIFPNPAYANELNISITLQEAVSADMEISNSNGELVYLLRKQHFIAGGQTINIELPELSAGIYQLTVRMQEKSFSKSFSIIN